MKRLYCLLHDAWCEITRRCSFHAHAAQTPMIEWLKEQEQYANESAEQIRERRRRRGIEENWRRGTRDE